METRKIIKSGNSLAVVIPAETAKRLKLKKGDTVAWVNGAIVKIAEKKKFYVGNGRVFWGDGVIPKNEINTTNIIEDIESESTELPF